MNDREQIGLYGKLPAYGDFLVRNLDFMSRTVGVLYAVNSGGAFAGVMLAGLVLLPRLGTRAAYAVAIGINLAVGVAMLALSRALPAAALTASAPRFAE